MNTPDQRPLAGTLTWSDGDNIHITVGFDKLCVSGGYLAMISCVGYQNDIKAMRAALAVGITAPMRFRDINGKTSSLLEGARPVLVEYASCLPGRRYLCETYRLGYGVLHATFVARYKGLMLENSDDALWAELKDPRYTTPLLRAWLPHLRKELVRAGKLVHTQCLDCECMGLTATTKDLDTIVEHGLQNGLITIAEEDAA